MLAKLSTGDDLNKVKVDLQPRSTIIGFKPREKINVIKSSPTEEVNFKELLMNNTPRVDRKDRLLRKKISKIFADGIRMDDPLEESSIRQAAYCLTLGLPPEYLR